MKKINKNNGITLIALVITIIVMLILVAVSISMAVNGGLFSYAGKATGDTQNEINAEKELADGRIKIGDTWYNSIDDYLNNKPSSNQGTGDGTGTEATGVEMILSISEGTKVAEKDITVPTGFTHTEGTIDNGYVIKDGDGNEFVWVPVNKDQKITLKVKSEKEIEECKLYDPAGNVIETVDKAAAEKGYENSNIDPTKNGMYIAVAKTTEGEIIQKTLIVKSLYAQDTNNDLLNDEYAKTNGFNSLEELVETGLSVTVEELLNQTNAPTLEVALAVVVGSGDTETADYTENVNKNGGFYIGRYEAGTTTVRTSGSSSTTLDDLISASGKPVSKEGAYPYTNVTYAQAKALAESMYEENSEFKVSLPEGRAWDRTLRWIYETKAKTYSEIYMDSTNWGNYTNAEFTITKGKYLEEYGDTFQEVSGEYKKESEDSVLLTTGTIQRNSANKIYDLAGNVEEWTSEVHSSGKPVFRGGYCGFDGDNFPVYCRINTSSDNYYKTLGFRCALYIK